VRGFSQIVEFALVQPHGSITKGTRDGGETFFHVARRTESWRFQTIPRLPSTLQALSSAFNFRLKDRCADSGEKQVSPPLWSGQTRLSHQAKGTQMPATGYNHGAGRYALRSENSGSLTTVVPMCAGIAGGYL